MKLQERRKAIKAKQESKPTPIPGIRYYNPPADSVLEGRDGKVKNHLEGPIPLLDADFANLANDAPSYDAVGRGIYLALRSNPDCARSDYYASLLKDAYPHLLSELATNLVMMDVKDVDVPYLDRKINYLKIFGLMERDNPSIPLEIGIIYFEKAMCLSALQFTTISLYRAEKYLARAVELAPADMKAIYHLGEVSYILGKYDNAARYWRSLIGRELDAEQTRKLTRRLQRMEQGVVSHVPAVDYLEVVAVAFGHYQEKEYEEAAAMLLDVLEDRVFSEEFPVAQIWYVLGLCYRNMTMPKFAEQYLGEALKIDPDYAEARQALDELYL